jgi:hypothetical protein
MVPSSLALPWVHAGRAVGGLISQVRPTNEEEPHDNNLGGSILTTQLANSGYSSRVELNLVDL